MDVCYKSGRDNLSWQLQSSSVYWLGSSLLKSTEADFRLTFTRHVNWYWSGIIIHTCIDRYDLISVTFFMLLKHWIWNTNVHCKGALWCDVHSGSSISFRLVSFFVKGTYFPSFVCYFVTCLLFCPCDNVTIKFIISIHVCKDVKVKSEIICSIESQQ